MPVIVSATLERNLGRGLLIAVLLATACSGRSSSMASSTAPATTPAAAPAPDPAADRRAVEHLLYQQRDAWNRGDLQAFMAAYRRSPDLIFTSGGHIRRGFDPTLSAFRTRYGNDRASMGQLAFDILDIRFVGRDAAVVLGNWRLTDTPQAGQGIFSLVLERTPDGWRIIHDHTTGT